MAKLPETFSVKAVAIKSAISEGRVEEAMQKLTQILETGKADGAIQKLAANWILSVGLKDGDAKALRGGARTSLSEWCDISDMVLLAQSDGRTYREAVEMAAKHFDYSMRHVEKCVALRNKVDREE